MVFGSGSLEGLAVNPDFWQGKRVLVTGHTGFKGGWLSLWLQSLGANLKGFALEPPTNPSLYVEALVSQGMQSEIGDIRDFPTVAKALSNFAPEIIIHMAAQPLVRHSYQQPIETYATNVMGTVHVLEAARLCGSVRAIVNVTTDKCYENREWVWGYRENEPLGGYDPYSSSKACAELVSSAYRQSFLQEAGIALATARAGNVIGGGDWASDRLVPDILRSLQSGSETVLVRRPHAIRPWQHVLEPLSGYLNLAQSLFENGQTDAEGWNFGPKDEDAKPVQWIAEHLCKQWGNDVKWHVQPGDHPHEAHFLKLDISKAHLRLKWKPRWDLEKALSMVVAWQRAYIVKDNMRQITLDQINEYIRVGEES